MTIHTIPYNQLEKQLQKTRKAPYDYLSPKLGKVYVINITRQKCPSCQKQKPKLQKLATTLTKQRRKVVFTNIHVNYSKNNHHESNRSKTLLGHHFYPTTLILTKHPTHGTINTYKNIEPTTTELKRNIKKTLKITTLLTSK